MANQLTLTEQVKLIKSAFSEWARRVLESPEMKSRAKSARDFNATFTDWELGGESEIDVMQEYVDRLEAQ